MTVHPAHPAPTHPDGMDRGFAVARTAIAAIAVVAAITAFWHWLAQRSHTDGAQTVASSYHRIVAAMVETVTAISTAPVTVLVVAGIAAIIAAAVVAAGWRSPIVGLWAAVAATAITALVVAVQTVIVSPLLLGGDLYSGDGLGLALAWSAVAAVVVWRARIDGTQHRPAREGAGDGARS